MTVAASPDEPVVASVARGRERRALGVASGAHVLHDGYTDLIWVALPIWQAEFGLSYAAVGLLRTAFSGVMASLQIPASMVAERLGGGPVLAVGTALAGGCFCLAAVGSGFWWLVVALVLGGLGAASQHPIGSALVARAFPGSRSLPALGTYNFAGDVGKVLLPGLATGLIMVMPWRPAYGLLGAAGVAAAVAIFLLTPRFAAEPIASAGAEASAERGLHGLKRGFLHLLAIGAVDNATRAGFLVFLPFLMIGKGAGVAVAGLAVTLVFAGGAAGKLVCAWLARFGVPGTLCITKALTAAGMLALLVLPVEAGLALLPFFGAVLTGSTSLTYGSVPRFVTPAARARAFGIVYTGTIGAGAIAPTLAGLLGDAIGVPAAIAVVAGLTLTVLPLAWRLRAAFAECASDAHG